jgi:hypothetical protein
MDKIKQFEQIATDYDLLLANGYTPCYQSRRSLFSKDIWKDDTLDFITGYNQLMTEYEQFTKEYRRKPPICEEVIEILDLFEKNNVIWATNYCWKVPYNFERDNPCPIVAHSNRYPFRFIQGRLQEVIDHDFNFTYADLEKFDLDCSMFDHSFHTLTKFADDSFKYHLMSALEEKIREICIKK